MAKDPYKLLNVPKTANDAEIQKTVVLMKDSLEKIKEQVLNVL